MKRISIILMAFALVLTMTQCKKNEETNQDEIVTISLDVKYNNGSKVDVNTLIGTVNFETGDKVYVGSGGKYVGFLTHNGTHFVGNITNPTENQPLQFYFLGNVTPTETLSAGTTEECSVIIRDQTEHLPVISTAASNENYASGLTSYTGHLLNKCALVKFNVTTPSNSPICITGMKNKVTVDFSQNTVTPSMDNEGVIKLPAGNGENVEKWAILLPQEALEEGEEGSAYSEDGTYSGIRPTIPTIMENEYIADGLSVTIRLRTLPEGAIDGLFSVSETQQVYFSQGNLQYHASTNTWRFAENQFDYVRNGNSNISPTYNGWIDLFGWGTSGYEHGATCYQPWNASTTNSSYYAYGSLNFDLYEQSGQADWGYNAISNGGNQEGLWRTMTVEEWEYLLNTRITNTGVRFAKAVVNGQNGVIILPDNWIMSNYFLSNLNQNEASYSSNIISSNVWKNALQSNGAVFLPAACGRNGIQVECIGTHGYYWSASSFDSNTSNCFTFSEAVLDVGSCYRSYGQSVRLVQDY